MNGKNGVDRLGRSVAASLALVAALGIWLRAGVAGAQTACPPPPDPVPGLSGGPKFLGGATDQFADKVDDPRWNGAYRDDYPDASETEVGVRMLKEGDGLFVSFDVKRDPNGAAVNADAVYVGFAKAGDANGVIAKISFTNPPSPATLVPATNTGDVIQVAFWKTADGGGHWTSTPASWASPTNVHAWTGSGTGTGSSWVISGRFSLAALATALGVSSTLAAPFQMWFDVDVSTGEGPIPYTWPAAVPYGTTSTPDVAVSSFGTVSTSCPSGVTIDPMHIGVMPLGPAGTPSTQPDVRPGQPPVDWIAQLITVGVPTPPNGNVEARFRIANWGSIGSGATWQDMASTTMKPGNQGGTITFRCVNTTPLPGETRCFVPNVATGHSRDQCLLVEMSRGTGPGVTFIRSSARRNMDFVTASTFERLAEISVEGLAPLPGSGGYRDVYIYVATQNMPSKASGPSRREIPRAVGSPAPPRAAAADATAARAVADDQPRYRMNTYERIASVMPTYEVHVYHDTGQTRSDGSHTVKVLEPQPPFGYFVQHSGDLSGWRHDLMGQGVTLEEISPNFFHVKVPDNGSIQVRTRIAACESCLLGLGTRCGGVGRGGCATCAAAGGIGGGTAGPVVLMLVVVLVLLSRRHRHR